MIENNRVVSFVKAYCATFESVQKGWLFGSRALNNARPTSDYDFAFEWVHKTGESWGAFTEHLREKNPTLNTLDLVRLDQVSDDFKTKILSEAVLIYDRNKKQ